MLIVHNKYIILLNALMVFVTIGETKKFSLKMIMLPLSV